MRIHGGDNHFQRQAATSNLLRVVYVNHQETIEDLGNEGIWEVEGSTHMGAYVRGYRMDRNSTQLYAAVVPASLPFTPREGDIVEIADNAGNPGVLPRVLGLHYTIGSHYEAFKDKEVEVDIVSPRPTFLRLPRDEGRFYNHATHLMTYYPRFPRENLFRTRHITTVFAERFRDLTGLEDHGNGHIKELLYNSEPFMLMAQKYQKRRLEREKQYLQNFRNVARNRFAYRVDPVFDHLNREIFDLKPFQEWMKGVQWLEKRTVEDTDRFPVSPLALDRLFGRGDADLLSHDPEAKFWRSDPENNPELDLNLDEEADEVEAPRRSRDPHVSRLKGQTILTAYDEVINLALKTRRLANLPRNKTWPDDQPLVDPTNVEEPHTPAMVKEWKLGRLRLTFSDMQGDGKQVLLMLKDHRDQSLAIVYDEDQDGEYTHSQVRLRDMMGNTVLMDSRLKEYSRLVVKDRAHQMVEMYSEPRGSSPDELQNEYILTRNAPYEDTRKEADASGNNASLKQVNWSFYTWGKPSLLAARFKRLPRELLDEDHPGHYQGSRDDGEQWVYAVRQTPSGIQREERIVSTKNGVKYRHLTDTFPQLDQVLFEGVSKWEVITDLKEGMHINTMYPFKGDPTIMRLTPMDAALQKGTDLIQATGKSVTISSAVSINLSAPVINITGLPILNGVPIPI